MLTIMKRRPVLPAVMIAAVAALTAVALWQTQRHPAAEDRAALVAEPPGIMGTTCRLVAVVGRDDAERGQRGLQAAEQALRRVEALASTYIDTSELSRFNRGESDRLSPMTVAMIRAAYDAWQVTDGAFDATARPQFELWKQCGKAGRLPTAEEMAQARAASSWQHLKWRDGQPIKQKTSVQIDLSGIAKGCAIDKAIEAMREAGVLGGLVDVGGDVRCWGLPPEGHTWPVGLRNPFGSDTLFTLRLREAAVCTSGNYARFVEIGGQRYSHIVDPRTGRPADHVPSVTVIGPDTTTADAWATALSVLGPEGLEKLPRGYHAMVVTGTVEHFDVATTPDFGKHMQGKQ
jgi:thiamine biosynthesis lipoprotein